MAQNSVDVSDYGMYDTSKINKEIRHNTQKTWLF
jgi:hypothetical protein